MAREDNVARFESIVQEIRRPGIEKLMEFIRKSDFYTAPASTRFHGSYEGGLLEHSLNVYDNLVAKKQSPKWKEILEKIPEESFKVIALFHDLCKTYYYGSELRNKKDENGKWIQVPFYTVEDKIPYGHGEKSVMMLQRYIGLTQEEIYAIRWHMGPYECDGSYQTLGTAMEMYPVILATFEADMEATYITEKQEDKQ